MINLDCGPSVNFRKKRREKIEEGREREVEQLTLNHVRACIVHPWTCFGIRRHVLSIVWNPFSLPSLVIVLAGKFLTGARVGPRFGSRITHVSRVSSFFIVPPFSPLSSVHLVPTLYPSGNFKLPTSLSLSQCRWKDRERERERERERKALLHLSFHSRHTD